MNKSLKCTGSLCYCIWKRNFDPRNKKLQKNRSNEFQFFTRTAGYTPFFLQQKEWRNFGRSESRTSWRGTKHIQIKLATTYKTMNNNRMTKIMLNCGPKWTEKTWKTFEETIRRGRNRSIKAWLMTDDNDDDCGGVGNVFWITFEIRGITL
jgi:hypothetical protein